MARGACVIRFPVRPRRRDAGRAFPAVVDLRGYAKVKAIGLAAMSHERSREKSIAVTLPRLASYGGNAIYVDGCLIINGKVVRERER